MTKVFAASVFLITFLAGAGALVTALTSPSALVGLALISIPAVLVVMIALFVGAVFALRYAFLSWVDVQHATQFVAPDENGLLPVARQALLTGPGAMRSLDIHHTKATAVPTHYSPRHTNTDVEPETIEQIAATFQPESFWQLWQAGKLPSNGFLMGYSLEDGEQITATWQDLYSALVGGQSGSGKSTLIRSILAQSAVQGGRFVVLDKHFGAGGESLGASLQPLRPLMLCDVAASEPQMIDAIAYVRDIGHRRLSGQDSDKTPVVLVVDETTAMLQRSTTAQALTDALGEISQETRKVGVYAFCIGQNFNGRIMDTTVRDSFVSFLSCRAKPAVARVMSGNNEFGKMANSLTIGQAVWMTPGGEVHKLAVPNCTTEDLSMLASHLGAKTHTETQSTAITPVGATSEVATIPAINATSLDAKAQRILGMIASGKSTSEIVMELHGVKGGRKFSEGAAEVNKVMQYLAMQTLGGNNG